VILVVLDSPRMGGRTGGVVAGPVFRAVAEATLRRLGVPPTTPDPHGLLARSPNAQPLPTPVSLPTFRRGGAGEVRINTALAAAPGTVPDVQGLSAREAFRVLIAAGLQPRLFGSGVVTRQQPAPGAVIVANQFCDLYLERSVAAPDPDRGLEP
jgi:cell division protein FtsI (penicillin-binding protein 3)